MTLWTFFIEHRSEIVSATLDHLVLVAVSMAVAILIATAGVLIVSCRGVRNRPFPGRRRPWVLVRARSLPSLPSAIAAAFVRSTIQTLSSPPR